MSSNDVASKILYCSEKVAILQKSCILQLYIETTSKLLCYQHTLFIILYNLIVVNVYLHSFILARV